MRFTELYQDQIYGVIEGLDRVCFRGTDLMLSNTGGFRLVLNQLGVLLKDLGKWADRTTKTWRAMCSRQAQSLGVPVYYLRGSGADKDALARKVAQEHGAAPDGSICMFRVLEPCVAPTVLPNRETQHLELIMLPRKCVFLYHYFDHPEVGFGHVRLQTWAPYPVTLCLNGRHWLEKQLRDCGVAYQKAGNCFPWIADVELAQALMDAQLKTHGHELLEGLVLNLCPELLELCAPFEIRYYWSADETEFATDVMFRSKAELDALFPFVCIRGWQVLWLRLFRASRARSYGFAGG